MTKELERAIKEAMGYTNATTTCQQCYFFVPDDCSGNHNAESRHCRFNPSFKMPVDTDGRCNQFTPLTKPLKR